jgi:carbon-monoxide dehydrogenase small subunit
MVHIRFRINGKNQEADVPDDLRALDFLRESLSLTGVKEGCGEGECGACTILMDGEAVCSCLLFAAQLDGKEIITIEGLETDHGLHPIQQSFIDEGAVQCGFCTPGMILAAKALLDHNPNPSPQEIRKGLEGNLCRCTGYVKIENAVEKASQKMKE